MQSDVSLDCLAQQFLISQNIGSLLSTKSDIDVDVPHFVDNQIR